MIHTIGAVKHDTVLGQGFGEILGGLGLSGTSRSGGGSSQIKLKGSHERHVALICEGCDNETTIVTEILVTVRETCDDTLYPDLVDFIQIRLPVVTELLDPLEGSHFVNFRIDQSSHDVQGMDINDDKSLNRDLSELLQGSNNELDSLFSLILKELVVRFKSLKTTFVHVLLYILGPEDLRGVQDDLTSLNLDPLSSGDLIIGI